MSEKLRQRLNKLIEDGSNLHAAMQYECLPDEFGEELKKHIKDEKKRSEYIEKLPNFSGNYQDWYSEAKAVVKQLLPDRFGDFVGYYERPKNRKEIKYGNYVISDYLRSLRVTDQWGDIKVTPKAAISEMYQQVLILKSVGSVFESMLFDLSNTLFADILDSEIEQSRTLLKSGFNRAAGAVAGVVLENHLGQVVEQHGLSSKKKKPTISDFNDLLKKSEVINTPKWRQIQYLGDIRNICDHKKSKEPSKDQVEEMIDGVEKVIKNVF